MNLLEITAQNALYHITTMRAWEGIKKTNSLLASRGELPKPGVKLDYENGFIKGFTKDGSYKSVADWKQGDFVPIIRNMVHVTRTKNINPLHMGDRTGARVIITLDLPKLRAAGYVVKPRLGDWGRSSEKHYEKGRRESEEIIYKKNDAFAGIENLSRFIVKVEKVRDDGSLEALEAS